MRVIVESPYAASNGRSVADNETFLDACLRDSLARGEAPFASHGFYPRVFDDGSPVERERGMQAGFAWGAVAELCAVYTDYGVSSGMERGIHRAIASHIPIEYRSLNAAG